MIQQLSNELKPLNRHIGNFQHLTAAPVIYCNIPLWLLVRRSSLINLSKFQKICRFCIYSYLNVLKSFYRIQLLHTNEHSLASRLYKLPKNWHFSNYSCAKIAIEIFGFGIFRLKQQHMRPQMKEPRMAELMCHRSHHGAAIQGRSQSPSF